jgi:hypothetical protein
LGNLGCAEMKSSAEFNNTEYLLLTEHELLSVSGGLEWFQWTQDAVPVRRNVGANLKT